MLSLKDSILVQHAKGMSLHSGYFDTPSLDYKVNAIVFDSKIIGVVFSKRVCKQCLND